MIFLRAAQGLCTPTQAQRTPIGQQSAQSQVAMAARLEGIGKGVEGRVLGKMGQVGQR